jgi:uncharacterized protein YecE (DUF72 family)
MPQELKDVETPLANFFASGVLRLEEKLGPFLWQLPPSLRFDPERLGKFFNLLPRDTAQQLNWRRSTMSGAGSGGDEA